MKLFIFLSLLLLLVSIATAPVPDRVRVRACEVAPNKFMSKRADRRKRARATGQLYR